ncbi:jg17853 [Pararge aegeria aegeria]|uniref:Jg17853 protein n=1 Tax=Pararge aegeria aegeria TaxID=348720 RepID=A0A8S4QTN1_9NEOP|nr:jg17853 [Pararge aegeria aegeria]
MMLAGAEIVESSVSFKTDEAGKSQAQVIAPGPSQPQAQASGLSRVPTREPVDIQFSNVTCTVKLGINKGIYHVILL